MGLDMYLSRAKRLGGATAMDVERLDGYFSWLNRSEYSKECTLEDWNGLIESDIPMHLVELYQPEYKKRYAYWDTEKKYGYDQLTDGVGYWRKANAVHNWFVENIGEGIDECQPMEVSREQLEELRDICHEVLCARDISTSESLLPTQSGFFFGSTNYDDWYYEDIEYTIKMIDEVLKSTDFDNEIIIYRASW